MVLIWISVVEFDINLCVLLLLYVVLSSDVDVECHLAKRSGTVGKVISA